MGYVEGFVGEDVCYACGGFSEHAWVAFGEVGASAGNISIGNLVRGCTLEDVQFLEELDCAVHCFWCGAVGFLAALFDALLFVGVVFQVLIVEF